MKKITSLLFALVSCFIQAQNYSLNFDGTDDFVEIPSSPELTQQNLFAIEAWIKIQDFVNQRPIVTKYNTSISQLSYYFSVLNTGKIRFAMYQYFPNGYRAIDTNSAPLTLNQWHHVAATFNLSTQTLKIYVDGNLVSSSLVSGSISLASIQSNTTPVNIGSVTGATGIRDYFKGNIDEVRIWSVERSQADIQSTMNTELTGNESGLVSYWKMDDDSQSCDVYDCNSNENHGTRIGTTGTNNLPQYSVDIPTITDVSCGASLSTCLLATDSFVESKGVSLYPNPTNGILNLDLQDNFGSVKVEVYSILGEKVYVQEFTNQQNIQFNFQGNSGIYFVKVKMETGYEKTFKVVKK